MKYTDEVPTVPGWYWQKRYNTQEEIVFLPTMNRIWPTHWKIHKQNVIQAEKFPQLVQELQKIPDEVWRVQWAGPIPFPSGE